jgi:hypothetical protein
MTAEAFAEVVGTPYVVYVGPVGTAAPDLDTDESAFDAAWKLLGTNGIDNQGANGVTVGLGRTQTHFTPAGGTLPVKSWTTDEAITVGGSVVDTTVEQMATILDDADITSQAAGSGTPGYKKISLVRGVAVEYFALLVRGLSPYDDGSGLNAQFEFARVFQSASQSFAFLKGTPAEVAWEFTIAGTVNGDDPAQYLAQNAPRT